MHAFLIAIVFAGGCLWFATYNLYKGTTDKRTTDGQEQTEVHASASSPEDGKEQLRKP
jgi:hypothetical protein